MDSWRQSAATLPGQYTRLDSFSSTCYKIALMNTLVNWVWAICSPCGLAAEIEHIKTILHDNGYPEWLICGFIQRKTANRSEDTVFGPEKCPVYLKLPWRGKISQKFEQQVKRSVSQCYNSVAMRVIFTTHKLLPSVQKDELPAVKPNNVIYEFQCRCDARYRSHITQTGGSDQAAHSIGNPEQIGDWSYTTIEYM